MYIDEKGLKEGFKSSNTKVTQTREKTMEEFKIDLSTMTSKDKEEHYRNKMTRKPSMVKQLASVYDSNNNTPGKGNSNKETDDLSDICTVTDV